MFVTKTSINFNATESKSNLTILSKLEKTGRTTKLKLKNQNFPSGDLKNSFSLGKINSEIKISRVKSAQ